MKKEIDVSKIYYVLRITGPKTQTPSIRAYRTALDLPEGNGFYIVSSEAELLASAIPNSGMVWLYNYCTAMDGEGELARFSDRATGASRLWQQLTKRSESFMTAEEAQPAASADEPKKPRKASGAFAGRRCYAKKEIWPENPRRKGTHGHKSLEILIMSEDNGILYEDFLAAGGRRVDLAWDINRGRAYIR